ncbi:MAG: hypothetical protein TREMPRED_004048 [Tremellales sp. Tagirdzhanova-0007]|nr:MAG: hypothetical protein TREMPRED_004048 [Tremellales sp. Tagirdzhanova-0007]
MPAPSLAFSCCLTSLSTDSFADMQFEADADRLRAAFAGYGDIKTYFDLVKNRGMIFITYFDLRAAERARDGMHNTNIGGRPIDVHYSLPRADEQSGPCDEDKNQGSVLVSLRQQRPINEFELGRIQKIVQYFDSRAAALFGDELQNKPFMGDTLDLQYVWDELDAQLPPPPASEVVRETSVVSSQPPRGSSDRSGRRSGEGPGYGEVRGGGYRGTPDSGNATDDRRGPYPTGPPPASNRYGEQPLASSAVDDRLEQARKVQQLLATLGANAAPPVATAPARRPPLSQTPVHDSYNALVPNRYQTSGPPQTPTSYAPTPITNYAPTPATSSYSSTRPPAPRPTVYDPPQPIPPNKYSSYQAPNATHPHPSPQSQRGNVPPDMYNMMQHQQQAQRSGPPSSQNYMSQPQPSGMPYKSPAPYAAPASQNTQGYAQGPQGGAANNVGSLLAMLVSRSLSLDSCARLTQDAQQSNR